MDSMAADGNRTQDQPLVSVIVPVFNAEDYLAQCLDSLVAQTLEAIEVIALDDGSTDSSAEILASYAKDHPRIRVVSKPNEGYGATVNRGIQEARGEYVGIVEPDDYADPALYAKLYSAAKRFDADLVKCDFFDTFESGEEARGNLNGLPHGVVFDPADYPEIVLVTPSIWAALYRRSMLVERNIVCRETPGAAFQDTSFALKCLVSARRFAAVGLPLLHYRRDNPNSSTFASDKVFTVANEFAEARSFLARDPERYKRFVGHLRLNEWRTHRWDSSRMDEGSRAAYFGRVKDEFTRAQAGGEIAPALFGPAEFERLQTLLTTSSADLGTFDPNDGASPLARALERDRANQVKISIVVPAYNDEACLARSVGSCLAQTHPNVEVVCVDDGSEDGTASVMQSFAEKDSRVKVVALGRHALTHNARLTGVRQATGDLVLFLDADDELARGACTRIAYEYARNPFDILQFAIRVSSDGRADRTQVRDMEQWCFPSQGPLEGQDILVGAFADFAYAANLAGKAFAAPLARAAFESVGPVEADYGEDQMEYFAIACRAAHLRTMHDKLYVYHLGDGLSGKRGMTAQDFARPLRGISALRGMRDFLERAEMLPEYEPVFETHRLGQVNALLRTFAEDVAPEEKPVCLRMMQAKWGYKELRS